MAISDRYEAAQMKARANFLQLDFIVSQDLQEVFAMANEEILALLRSFEVRFGPGTRRARLTAMADQLEILSANIAADVEAIILDNANLGARIGARGQVNATRALLAGYDVSAVQNAVSLFATVPADAVRASLARSYQGAIFSDRIWEIEQGTRRMLSQVIGKGIAQGKSAFKIAKDVEPYLIADSKAWERYRRETDEIAQGVRKRRSQISWEAKRLARTEINAAYKEANYLAADRAPWVIGVKWRLSGSHAIPDICDIWATQDIHDLGSGVYPPLETPIDHPNGICYTTNELVPIEQLPRIIDQLAA